MNYAVASGIASGKASATEGGDISSGILIRSEKTQHLHVGLGCGDPLVNSMSLQLEVG